MVISKRSVSGFLQHKQIVRGIHHISYRKLRSSCAVLQMLLEMVNFTLINFNILLVYLSLQGQRVGYCNR